MDIVRVYPEQVFYILRMIALSEPRCSGILPLRKSRGRMAKAKNILGPRVGWLIALQSEQIKPENSSGRVPPAAGRIPLPATEPRRIR